MGVPIAARLCGWRGDSSGRWTSPTVERLDHGLGAGRASSFSIALRTWVRTVSGERTRRLAICSPVSPSARTPRTSDSRLLSAFSVRCRSRRLPGEAGVEVAPAAPDLPQGIDQDREPGRLGDQAAGAAAVGRLEQVGVVEPGVDDELRADAVAADPPHQLGPALVGQVDAHDRHVGLPLADHLLAARRRGRAAEDVEPAPFEQHREPVAERLVLLDQD